MGGVAGEVLEVVHCEESGQGQLWDKRRVGRTADSCRIAAKNLEDLLGHSSLRLREQGTLAICKTLPVGFLACCSRKVMGRSLMIESVNACDDGTECQLRATEQSRGPI